MSLHFPEARRRTELYREASERRKEMTAGHDYPAMMKSLKLQFGFRTARSSDMERLLELIQRTNQFNTTTKRRSAAEIQTFSLQMSTPFTWPLYGRCGLCAMRHDAVRRRRAAT
jgi:predicted enzyme involved in methoxymalonyl-ACP biosynthesis